MYSWKDKGIHTFLKGISPKVYTKVQYFSHYDSGTPHEEIVFP